MLEVKVKARELYFIFDKAIAYDFICELDSLSKNGHSEISAFDTESQQLKKLELTKGIVETAKVSSTCISLCLTCEAIDFAVYKLRQFLDVGYISPSEYYEFQIVSNKLKPKAMRTYFMKKEVCY